MKFAPEARVSQLFHLAIQSTIRPRGYKTFFVLNSVEHEILNARMYKNIKKFGLFKAQLILECYFSAHKCLNANNCWHFNIYEREKVHAQLSWAWKKFYNLRPWTLCGIGSWVLVHQTERYELSLTYNASWWQRAVPSTDFHNTFSQY